MRMYHSSEKLRAGKNCEVSVVEKRCCLETLDIIDFPLDSRWSNAMKRINVYVGNYEAKALVSLI